MELSRENIEVVTLREYRSGDLDAMYQLDLVCFEPPFRFNRRAMRFFAQAPGSISLIAESGVKLVGFCVVQVKEQVGYVVTLDVAPEWRRHGLAMRLMKELEMQARAAGAMEMALHVFVGNLAAIRFYERIGYVRTGLAKSFYGRGVDALVYRKACSVTHKADVFAPL